MINIWSSFSIVGDFHRGTNLIQSNIDKTQFAVHKYGLNEGKIFQKIQENYGETENLSYMLRCNSNNFILLKYIKGTTNFQEIIDGKNDGNKDILFECDLLKIFVNCLHGLNTLHNSGYIHNNLEGCNVLIKFGNTELDIQRVVIIDLEGASEANKSEFKIDIWKLMLMMIYYIDGDIYESAGINDNICRKDILNKDLYLKYVVSLVEENYYGIILSILIYVIKNIETITCNDILEYISSF